jgi:asparagine synthase (glutamine-hydrolysing)
MCGITGFLDISVRREGSGELIPTVRRMAEAICHRGPDDQGVWADSEAGLALGFRRLAILDLSPTGHQPMLSADERYVMVFNGEVYNYAELRRNLEALGHPFRGTSDTEVMLAAIVQWGLEAAVRNFNGMFAIALWDRQKQVLHLIRDRLGVKPLYYGWCKGVFLFGSELKALRAHPAFDAEIDRDSLSVFLRHSYVPAPHSIYRDIHKLPPGTIFSLPLSSGRQDGTFTTYWSVREAVEQGKKGPFQGTPEEAVSQLDSLLRESVRLRMIADVPLGAFLSGGIDSSAIVALMQTQSRLPVKTFTIGFYDNGYNEAEYAKAIAVHLGTEHTELYITPEAALAVIPRLPTLYDEPFSDPSQIPTFLVSQLARQHVTVSLSGDGGDELFGGYTRYSRADLVWSLIGGIPSPMRGAASRLFSRVSLGRNQPFEVNNKLYSLAEMLKSGQSDGIYLRAMSHFAPPDAVVINGREPLTLQRTPESWPLIPEFIQRMMYLDMVTYLPDDILVKLDRASMGVSLEGRVPLLDDHRVAEFAWRLPLDLKIRGRVQKWILRQVLYRYVPKEMVERPKMGFGVPISSWLRGPLREWAESLLNENRLRQEGYFNPSPIREKWTEHISRKYNWQYYLWDVLMFQAWLEANRRYASLTA